MGLPTRKNVPAGPIVCVGAGAYSAGMANPTLYVAVTGYNDPAVIVLSGSTPEALAAWAHNLGLDLGNWDGTLDSYKDRDGRDWIYGPADEVALTDEVQTNSSLWDEVYPYTTGAEKE